MHSCKFRYGIDVVDDGTTAPQAGPEAAVQGEEAKDTEKEKAGEREEKETEIARAKAQEEQAREIARLKEKEKAAAVVASMREASTPVRAVVAQVAPTPGSATSKKREDGKKKIFVSWFCGTQSKLT